MFLDQRWASESACGMAVRVLYRWRVSGERKVFERAWQQLTTSMLEVVPGARGSVLMWAGPAGPEEAVAMARWESRELWEARLQHHPNPAAEAVMSEMASLLAVEVLDERFDLTVA